ncbi:alpha/beta fold hydrolase [Arthrobacter sp. BF1]|uniref:alpha/beta fold hydrolase n=1 Tax=Arthrobacter sp. BF1 TaxID=2821145 RepID=UPI001C50200B|nr:alpha/beta hydrolase [Arthrobacter sp. BF1]
MKVDEAMTGDADVNHFHDAVTRTVGVGGVGIAYREIGSAENIPLVALTHLGANLDNWDPRIVDALATGRRLILLGYQGVGRSCGPIRARIEEMAGDAIKAIRALVQSQIDLFGLSMGGMVSQEIAHRTPWLVSRLILAISGPPVVLS